VVFKKNDVTNMPAITKQTTVHSGGVRCWYLSAACGGSRVNITVTVTRIIHVVSLIINIVVVIVVVVIVLTCTAAAGAPTLFHLYHCHSNTATANTPQLGSRLPLRQGYVT